MEPQNNIPEAVQKDSFITPLTRVTPISKYLALGLFVILPFLGAWVGYMLAPEKMVEVRIQSEKVLDYNQNVDTVTNSTSEADVSISIATDSPVSSYECTSVGNPYPHLCFSLKPESSSVEGIKNLTEEAKKQGVISGRTTLQSVEYETAGARKIYFAVGIPDSDACCGLVVFDTKTHKFDKVDLYKGKFKSFWSTDKRYYATVEDNLTLYVVDLETEKIVNKEVISLGSLESSKCGFTGGGYDISFNIVKQGFDYGIYSDKTEPGDECKQEKINDGFISLKKM